jgi:hypothetical protein
VFEETQRKPHSTAEEWPRSGTSISLQKEKAKKHGEMPAGRHHLTPQKMTSVDEEVGTWEP